MAHLGIEAKHVASIRYTMSIFVEELVSVFQSAFILFILGKFAKHFSQKFSLVFVETGFCSSCFWRIIVEVKLKYNW